MILRLGYICLNPSDNAISKIIQKKLLIGIDFFFNIAYDIYMRGTTTPTRQRPGHKRIGNDTMDNTTKTETKTKKQAPWTNVCKKGLNPNNGEYMSATEKMDALSAKGTAVPKGYVRVLNVTLCDQADCLIQGVDEAGNVLIPNATLSPIPVEKQQDYKSVNNRVYRPDHYYTWTQGKKTFTWLAVCTWK